VGEQAGQQEQHRPTRDEVGHRRRRGPGGVLCRPHHDHLRLAGHRVELVELRDRRRQRRPQRLQLGPHPDAVDRLTLTGGVVQVGDVLVGLHDLLAQRLLLLLGDLR
jgi:hypothetical protein